MALAPDVAETIGTRIRDARQAAGISQAALGESVGLNRVQIAKYERGEKWPNVQRLIAICKVLKTTPDEILGF